MEIRYRLMIFTPDDEAAWPENVNDRLRASLQAQTPNRIGVNEHDLAAESSGEMLTAWWDNWSLSAYLSAEPFVAEESQEMAARHDDEPPWDQIGRCKRRIELWSDDDPEMAHFNTYLFVLAEIRQRFPGAILVDGDGGLI